MAGHLGCGRSGRWPAVSPSGLGGNPASFTRRARRDEFYSSRRTPDGGPIEGAPVLEPIEHSVLENPLDGGPKEMDAWLDR